MFVGRFNYESSPDTRNSWFITYIGNYKFRFPRYKKGNDHYVVTIQKSKTDIARKGFQFFVQGSDMEIIDKYIDFFKINERTGRFIRKFENFWKADWKK